MISFVLFRDYMICKLRHQRNLVGIFMRTITLAELFARK